MNSNQQPSQPSKNGVVKQIDSPAATVREADEEVNIREADEGITVREADADAVAARDASAEEIAGGITEEFDAKGGTVEDLPQSEGITDTAASEKIDSDKPEEAEAKAGESTESIAPAKRKRAPSKRSRRKKSAAKTPEETPEETLEAAVDAVTNSERTAKQPAEASGPGQNGHVEHTIAEIAVPSEAEVVQEKPDAESVVDDTGFIEGAKTDEAEINEADIGQAPIGEAEASDQTADQTADDAAELIFDALDDGLEHEIQNALATDAESGALEQRETTGAGAGDAVKVVGEAKEPADALVALGDAEAKAQPLSAVSGAEKETDAPQADAPEEDAPEEAESDTLIERSPLVMNAVKIRGRPGGVAIEMGEGEWEELVGVLRDRLVMAEGFFRGGRAVLDVGDRALSQAELEQVFTILTSFEMQMALVRSGAETTLESAAALGVSATTGEVEDPMRGVVEAHSEEEAAQEPTAYYVHQGNLRSGQVLQRVESVIVIGDVNPGAQVVSNGDVLIYGRLRGSVHAGAEGDEQTMVTALEFRPTQLRIAGLTSVPPEEKKPGISLLFWKKKVEPGAEFAYVTGGRIYVEPWNATKPGSLTSRRRR